MIQLVCFLVCMTAGVAWTIRRTPVPTGRSRRTPHPRQTLWGVKPESLAESITRLERECKIGPYA